MVLNCWTACSACWRDASLLDLALRILTFIRCLLQYLMKTTRRAPLHAVAARTDKRVGSISERESSACSILIPSTPWAILLVRELLPSRKFRVCRTAEVLSFSDKLPGNSNNQSRNVFRQLAPFPILTVSLSLYLRRIILPLSFCVVNVYKHVICSEM